MSFVIPTISPSIIGYLTISHVFCDIYNITCIIVYLTISHVFCDTYNITKYYWISNNITCLFRYLQYQNVFIMILKMVPETFH